MQDMLDLLLCDSSINKPGWDIKLAPGIPSTNSGNSNNTNIDANSRIQNTTSIQSVPLIEGDSINYFWTLKNNNIPDRKYRIKLHLTDNTSNTNTIPSDSIANTSEYPNITSHGVPII